MKILVLTRGCWDKNNNTGNTMDNFFSGFEGVEIHNLYFRSELPRNNPCKSIFQISEQQLIKNILKRTSCGKEITDKTESTNETNSEMKMYNVAKKRNWTIFSYARELIWTFGKWKNKRLDEYLEKVNPDIVFMPVYNCWYPHKVLRYIKKKTNAKIVLFHADDNYTLKQFSLSPLYWLYRFNLRKWVRKSEKISSLDYAISDIQCKEYSKAFNKEVKILYKGYNFDVEPKKRELNRPLKMVFTGNISMNRYKSLSLIGKAIKEINGNCTENSRKLELDIYTTTPITKKMQKMLFIDGINMKGSISGNMVPSIQQEADVLVHAESFDLKNKLLVRQSFSTKIVDYFKNGKCIFAIGPKKIASIEYLRKNDAAIIVDDKKVVFEKLKQMLNNQQMIYGFGEKAWKCGEKNHQIEAIQTNLKNDFENLLKQELLEVERRI